MNQVDSTAIHEAGHALGYLVTDRPVDHVTAGCHGRFQGRTVQIETRLEPDPREEILRHLYGPAAEALIVDEFDWVSWRSDICVSVYFSAFVLEEDDCLSYLASGFNHAIRQFSDPIYWSAVNSLATELCSVPSRTVKGDRAFENMRLAMETPLSAVPSLRASPPAGLSMLDYLSREFTRSYVVGIMQSEDSWLRHRPVWPFIRVSTEAKALTICQSLGWSGEAAEILFRQSDENRDSLVSCFKFERPFPRPQRDEEEFITKVIGTAQPCLWKR